MWVFLVTEIMFFGGMFFAYTLYRWKYPLEFASASNHLDLPLGTVNTIVLILSSFTMALAFLQCSDWQTPQPGAVFVSDDRSWSYFSWYQGR